MQYIWTVFTKTRLCFHKQSKKVDNGLDQSLDILASKDSDT